MDSPAQRAPTAPTRRPPVQGGPGRPIGGRLGLLAPLVAFMVVYAGHALWSGLYSVQNPALVGWVGFSRQAGWLDVYVTSEAYWRGYSYALSAALGAWALAGTLRDRRRCTRAAALGGVTLSGALAFSGCFLVGCCGSPMLPVWLGLFGAGVLPFAQPLVALLTTVMIGAAWFWMARRRGDLLSRAQAAGDPGAEARAKRRFHE